MLPWVAPAQVPAGAGRTDTTLLGFLIPAPLSLPQAGGCAAGNMLRPARGRRCVWGTPCPSAALHERVPQRHGGPAVLFLLARLLSGLEEKRNLEHKDTKSNPAA